MRTMHAPLRAVLLAFACACMGGAHAQEPTETTPAGDVPAQRLLHAMFQDHAVLQRDQPIAVWGQAAPGAVVQVTLSRSSARVRADSTGRWQARLSALPAGGPHELVARSGGREQRAADVLVGDVWLCSGQSNMELQVWRSLDARAEIASASAGTIRLLTVPQAGSALPLETFDAPTRWHTVDSDSLRDFSAACFYFARELQKTVQVPMGLINASWGGSRIEAWTSGTALRTDGGYDDALDVLDLYASDPVAAITSWGRLWADWWRAREDVGAGDEPWSQDYAPGAGWRTAPETLGAWERWGVPDLEDYNGMVWYRAAVQLTEAQAAQDALLELGPADEIDMTWINGRAVGSTYGAGNPRAYAVPAGSLRAGTNAVAINVLDTYRDGGLAAASAHALRLADGTRVPVEGWQYRVAAGTDWPPRAPWQSAAGLSTLSNGMIAPLGRYGLRGALWYQGESNTSEGRRYAGLLRLLRSDWRTRFGAGLPLLVVQLPGYGMPASAPQESGWALLRESQRAVAAEDARTGLAVTIDIGDRYDIHPPNKQEVGRRLSRVARQVVYGEKFATGGPVPLAARREGSTVVVAFKDVGDGLVAHGAAGPIAFELCGEQPESCRFAAATLRGNEVLLHVPDTAPLTRVRHAWADSPVVTLFDAAGHPAGPFDIPVQ